MTYIFHVRYDDGRFLKGGYYAVLTANSVEEAFLKVIGDFPNYYITDCTTSIHLVKEIVSND